MTAFDDTPIGARLGSERLFDAEWPEERLQEHREPVVHQAPRIINLDAPVKPETPTTGGLPAHGEGPERPTPAKRVDVNWRNLAANTLQLTGIAVITVGCALIGLWLAFIVGGAALVLLGVATGLNRTE